MSRPTSNGDNEPLICRESAETPFSAGLYRRAGVQPGAGQLGGRNGTFCSFASLARDAVGALLIVAVDRLVPRG